GPAMGDRDQDVADPPLLGDLTGGAADQDLGPAILAVADRDVGPADALAPAGADRLQDRLLGRPAPGEVLDRMLPRLAVADLALGVHAAEEQLAVLLDHLADPRAFDDVGADPQDLHRQLLPAGVRIEPAARCGGRPTARRGPIRAPAYRSRLGRPSREPVRRRACGRANAAR